MSTFPLPHRRWWRRVSLRARLTVAATLVIALGISVAATLLVLQLHTALQSGLDSTVRRQAQDVAAALNASQFSSPLRVSNGEGNVVIQVIDEKGHVVTGSANIDGNERLFVFPAAVDSSNAPIHTVTGVPVGDNGATYRVVAVTARLSGHRYTVYAGAPTTAISDSISELSGTLTVGLPIVILLLGSIGWLLVGRALRPVETMRRQASAIPATDLHRRLTLPPANDELHRLADTFNELLRRLDIATSRHRQFVADAAHELRSPLAAVRTQLEVAQMHPAGPGSVIDVPDLLSDVLRLSKLVDDLVALARIDANPVLRRAEVDLDEVVFEQVAQSRRGTNRSIDIAGVSGARVHGDPSALTRIVANLLDNAIRHATSRVVVTLTTHAGNGVAALTIADDGAGIAADDRQRVFERFVRLDEARDRDAGGSGLGLSIVEDLVRAHDGTVSIEDNHPGARFVVRFPTLIA